MDGKPESEAEPSEFPEWELLQPNSTNEPPLQLSSHSPPPLIRPDYFSLHPNISNSNSNSNSNSSSNSTTDPSEVDRNFDDSYVADQLFQSSSNLHVWNDSDNNKSLSDSDSDAKTTVTAETATTTTTTTTTAPGELLLDGDGDGDLNSKEEEEEGEEEQVAESASEEKRRMAWWKVPFEVLKYWVVRVSPVPVWSLSVAAAAAFLGLLFLGRRLYKMKRKTQTLKLDLALDDKKASQLMGRVARLNEAFSVVRRVPIVRPSLPASSVTLRPVMSMR